MALLLSTVLGSAVRTVIREPPKWTHCKRYSMFVTVSVTPVPLSEAVARTTLMLTSNQHIMMFRTTTNGDLCDFLRSFVAFPHKPQKNARQYKCYWTQYFPCTLQYTFQYSYVYYCSIKIIYIAIYMCIAVTWSHTTGTKWNNIGAAWGSHQQWHWNESCGQQLGAQCKRLALGRILCLCYSQGQEIYGSIEDSMFSILH